MTRKTDLVSLKSAPAKFIVVVLGLVVSGGLSVDFDEIEGITPGSAKSMLVHNKGLGYNTERSFILNWKDRFYGFPTSGLRVADPIAVPMGSTDEKNSEEPSKTEPIPKKSEPKLQIPNEGGVVSITVPAYGRIHKYPQNKTDKGVSRKVNSNSVTIPDDGGLVHIDVPDYVKYGIKRGKKARRNSVDGLTMFNGTLKDSADVPEQTPGKDNVVSGSANSTASVGRGGPTLVSNKETTAATSQPEQSIYIGTEQYPFFAAIHSMGSNGESFDDVVCSGGILSKTAVVTSCSCLFGGDWPIPSSGYYYVTVGHKKFATVENTVKYAVKHVKYHPSCEKKDYGLWQGNIAMMVIADPGIEFGDNVRPMNLPKLRMWDASDVLAKMSDQRRHCRVIGWSLKAPLIDSAIGKLIPLDECANPVCRNNMPCPRRTTVDGFMVEITINEPFLLPGALLYCSRHVFAIVNTKRQCSTNNVFAACSPEELLYSKFSFELEPWAKEEMGAYNGTFLKSIAGWETYTYPTVESTTLPTGLVNTTNTTRQELLAEIASSASMLFPFYISPNAAWIYSTYVFAAGYYFFIF